MSDLVVWLLAVLIDGRALRPYNVGASQAIAIAALAERCAAVVGSGEVAAPGRATAGRDYVPDVARATGELGLAVNVSLDDAIARTSSWRARVRGSLVCRERPARDAARAQG
jgi:nucleoside-diphosphate-sugar epimerase